MQDAADTVVAIMHYFKLPHGWGPLAPLLTHQRASPAVITQQRLQAGNLPPDANLLAIMAQVVAQQAQLQGTVAQVAAQQVQLQGTVARLDARLDNTRARQQNARAEAAGPAQVLQLVPLVKERLPPAGAAAGAAHAAAVGTLPPAGMFPATWPAIATLHNQHFNALSHFYGEAFGQQGALAPRRAAFIMFIKS